MLILTDFVDGVRGADTGYYIFALRIYQIFAEEFVIAVAGIAPLLFELEGYMRNRLDLHGFWEWLDLTNFGNHYKLIKVLDQWAQMAAKDDGQGRKGKTEGLIVNG